MCRILIAHPTNKATDFYSQLNVHFNWGVKQHRLSFLIGQDGTIKHFFDKFKTKDHHQVVLDYLTK
jgi:peroxiredoxin